MVSFDYLRRGARAYIAISGGIATPTYLGSRSTYLIGALGGVDGRAVGIGDMLPLGEGASVAEGRTVPEHLRRRPPACRELPALTRRPAPEPALRTPLLRLPAPVVPEVRP